MRSGISSTYGIYGIFNTINNKVYIGSTGSTQGFSRRWASHRYKLRNNKAFNSYLQHAWDKYGEDSFEFKIIEECGDNERIQKENDWIKHYDSMNRDKGYNLKDAEQFIMSEEIKQKISNSLKSGWANGNIKTTAKFINTMSKRMSGINNPMYGISLPRTKIQIINAAKKLSKPVNQIDTDGKIINTFPSIREAHRKFNTLPNNSIGLCCRGKKKQAYGFRWEYSLAS